MQYAEYLKKYYNAVDETFYDATEFITNNIVCKVIHIV